MKKGQKKARGFGHMKSYAEKHQEEFNLLKKIGNIELFRKGVYDLFRLDFYNPFNNHWLHVSNRIEIIRLVNGMTRKELAEVSGVHYESIVKIENMVYPKAPSLESLVKIVNAFNLPIDLFTIGLYGPNTLGDFWKEEEKRRKERNSESRKRGRKKALEKKKTEELENNNN